MEDPEATEERRGNQPRRLPLAKSESLEHKNPFLADPTFDKTHCAEREIAPTNESHHPASLMVTPTCE